MSTCNILFTSVGRRVSLIKHFKRALNELNIAGKLIGADASSHSPAFHVTDKSYEVPRITDAEYIPSLMDICSNEQITMVIPLLDTELSVLAENQFRFRDIGTKVIISTPEVIRIGMYKTETHAFYQRNSIDTPEFITHEDLERGSYNFPLIVKPNDGSAGKMVFKAETREQLRFFKNYVTNAIVQEFIDGNEYTLDIFMDFTGRAKCVVPRLRLEVRAGEVSKGLIVKHPEVIRAGHRVAECLPGAIGCITLQCMVDKDERIKMLEINPRFGGGVPLSIEAGADIPKWLIKMVLGEELGDVANAYEDGLMMLRYDDAIFVKQ